MDEDLKIVLTSELEADEQASARRISAQLPNIARLINSKSNIKVGVTLDESTIQAQTQKLTQQIVRATKTHGIGVSLSLDQSSVDKIQTALNDLDVSPDISQAMTEQLDQMGIQIDKISARWDTVAEKEEKALTVSLNGTDQLGRTVAYVGTYNTEMGKLEQKSIAVVDNLEKQRQTESRLAAQAKKDNESRVSYLNQQQILLDKLNAKYTDPNAAKPIVYEQDLEQVNAKYNEIRSTIELLGDTQGKISSQAKNSLESQIASFDALAKRIRNAEYVATTLRTKTTKDVNAEQVEKLAEYENKLRFSGKLTDTFRVKIAELRNQLDGAFDSNGLTDYLNQFDRLKSEVGSFDSQLSSVNAGFSEMAAYEKTITSIKKEMLKSPSDSVEYGGLQSQLELQLRRQKEISSEIGKQIAKNPELIRYASEYNHLLFIRKDCAAQIAVAEGRVVDAAKAVDDSMQTIPAVIQNIEARFENLTNAPTELTQRVKSLAALMDEVSDAKDDKGKIDAYQKLKEAISGCNKEITQLMGVQRKDIQDLKFAENLEKAKADLATIGRQWSALKQDKGLNAQFQQLGESLKYVERGEKNLSVWTAEFNRFKSEVKAAGKNVQSLGDILKNNITKVTQWATATASLYRALSLLRSSVNIVIGLDTAMIDLKKTTEETDAAYERFYLSANKTAKQLGVTTADVISQTAEWSRLGYTMQEAAKMAENSAIFTAISPELTMEESTDGLISIMKAFGIEADEVLDGVISKINKLGNEMAISNKDIVEVMTRASSAMKAANNSFEETSALAVAAVEITRNSEQAGNALRTLSMRIRGYDEETEEYSEDIATLTGEIADLTKVASNNNRGVSLFEVGDPEQYRSTYDILRDIADIWDELTDKNQAQLLEVLFGKQRAQVGAAILSKEPLI